MEKVSFEIKHFTLEDAVAQFDKIMKNYYNLGYTMLDGSGVIYEDFAYILQVGFERKIDA